MKVALISSVFGNFDNPLPLPDQGTPYDFFMFNEKSGFLFRQELDNRLRAKYFKFQSHRIPELKGYDIIIWMDGNFQIKSGNFVEYMVRQVRDYDLAITLHNKRDCVYQEADFIINNTKPYITSRYGHQTDLMKQQIAEYREKGLPENAGLFCGGLFARKNNELMNRVMDEVWLDVMRYASQDQNPLAFHLWKNNVKVNRLPVNIVRNHFWELKNHA